MPFLTSRRSLTLQWQMSLFGQPKMADAPNMEPKVPQQAKSTLPPQSSLQPAVFSTNTLCYC